MATVNSDEVIDALDLMVFVTEHFAIHRFIGQEEPCHQAANAARD